MSIPASTPIHPISSQLENISVSSYFFLIPLGKQILAIFFFLQNVQRFQVIIIIVIFSFLKERMEYGEKYSLLIRKFVRYIVGNLNQLYLLMVKLFFLLVIEMEALVVSIYIIFEKKT